MPILQKCERNLKYEPMTNRSRSPPSIQLERIRKLKGVEYV